MQKESLGLNVKRYDANPFSIIPNEIPISNCLQIFIQVNAEKKTNFSLYFSNLFAHPQHRLYLMPR